MKTTINALHNQNLFDIALQTQGDIRSVIEVALQNELSITDVLFSGVQLQIEPTTFKNNDIVTYYQRRNQSIATNTILGVDYFLFTSSIPFIL